MWKADIWLYIKLHLCIWFYYVFYTMRCNPDRSLKCDQDVYVLTPRVPRAPVVHQIYIKH